MAEITIRIPDKALKYALLILIIICLGWGFLYVWSTGTLRLHYRLTMYVSEVGGLDRDAPVRLDGVNVGTVEGISVVGPSASAERRIRLDLKIQRRYQDEIRSESNATLVTEGLLGSRYVNISRGFGGAPIEAGGELRVVPAQKLTLTNFLEMLDCVQKEAQSAKGRATGDTRATSNPH